MSNPEKRKRDHVKDFFDSLSPFSSTSKRTSKDEKPESKEPGPSEPSKDQDSSQDNGGCQYKPRGRVVTTFAGPGKQKEDEKNKGEKAKDSDPDRTKKKNKDDPEETKKNKDDPEETKKRK